MSTIFSKNAMFAGITNVVFPLYKIDFVKNFGLLHKYQVYNFFFHFWKNRFFEKHNFNLFLIFLRQDNSMCSELCVSATQW